MSVFKHKIVFQSKTEYLRDVIRYDTSIMNNIYYYADCKPKQTGKGGGKDKTEAAKKGR